MDPVIPADATLEEIRDFFSKDKYAAALNPVIEEARPGYARVSMVATDEYRNAMGALMGGVPYVLSDFAFAIASNVAQVPAVSASSSIDYLSAMKDPHLVAECVIEKDGRSLCFAKVSVTDGTGRVITRMNVTGFRMA